MEINNIQRNNLEDNNNNNNNNNFIQLIYSIKYNETLKGRLLTIDSLRGVAIIMVLLLHATQYCVDERKLQDLSKTPYTLLLYYVGGMSGLFFVLSSLGTSISIFKRLYNNNNNNKSNNDDEKDYNFQTTIKNIRYSQINRSFMLIAVGYLSQLFVYRIVENNIIMHYSNGGLGRLTNEQLEWVFINPFVRNFIIEGIGFSTLITSLITIEVLSRKWTLQKIMKLYTMLVILILIFNPILRVGLDHLTCCTPTDCSYYPSNDGFNTLSSPKEIILPPNNTCSIVKNGVPITWTKQENGEEENAFNTKEKKRYTLCEFQNIINNIYYTNNTGGYRDVGKRPLIILNNNKKTSSDDDIHQLNMSISSERDLACNTILNNYGKRDSKYGIHTHGLGNVGRLWCTVQVGIGTENATFVGKICKLKPWWGRGVDIGYDEVKAGGIGGTILIIFLLQPLFGRFGIFAYLAPSLIGSFIGIVIIFERKTNAIIFSSSSSSFTIPTTLLRNDKKSFVILQLKWLRIMLLNCFIAFFIGFIIFVLLIVWRSDDVALQAGSHIRLFCGGGEIALVLFLLVVVENNKERLKFVKNRCRSARRFGAITLTLWVFQFLNLLICMLFDEIGGRQKPWISRPNGSREYEWNIFLVLFVIILFWYLLAIVLERFQFKGSCEWCLTKCMRKQSSRNNILASIDSKSMYDNELMNDDDNVETNFILFPCHQICFCCCCCWSKHHINLEEEEEEEDSNNGKAKNNKNTTKNTIVLTSDIELTTST